MIDRFCHHLSHFHRLTRRYDLKEAVLCEMATADLRFDEISATLFSEWMLSSLRQSQFALTQSQVDVSHGSSFQDSQLSAPKN